MKLFDPIPPRTIPPNAITATAMAFGLVSVYLSHSGGNLQTAAWFVLLSTLLDKLDGSVARALKGSSEFGVQFDSFADFIAFGCAPAALVYAAATRLTPEVWGLNASPMLGIPAQGLLAVVCLAYAVMTSVRLARFNVTTATIGPYLFLGLPSTLSGGLLCSFFLTIYELGLDRTLPGIFAVFPFFLALNAALMVCNLPLPKFKTSKNAGMRTFQLVAAASVYVLVPLQIGFTAVLALLLGYLAIGFTYLGPRLQARLTATPPA